MTDSPVFTMLCRALRQQGWQYHRIDGREVVEMGFEARSGHIHVLAQAFAPIGAIGFTAEAGGGLEFPHRAKLAELLMRVNLQLTIGNFEMDWDNLRVFFRTTNVFESTAVSTRVLVGMVHAAVAECDRMNFQIRALAATPAADLPGYDIGRLLRREDLFPEP